MPSFLVVQQCVNLRKSNVSGLPGSALPGGARQYLPNSRRRVFSGCRLSANFARRSLRSIRKRSATAPRMRASACVTASRLCVRTVLCSSAFLLVRLSPSTDSEAAGGDARVNFYSFFTNAEIQLALFTRLEPGRELLNSKLDLAGSRHVEKERRRYTDRSHPLPRDLR